jgi:low affinity Fe/Cu permease
MQSHLRTLAETVARPARSYWGFFAALVVVLAWGVGWAVFDFSETWHRGFDVLATVVMLLLIFSLEVTQSRSNSAIHLKLDELLRANEQARTKLVKMEERTDEELEALNEEFRALPAQEALSSRK